MKKKKLVGWTLKDLLRKEKWHAGQDFRMIYQVPLLVSEPHYASPKEFVKVRITIQEI